ncbi:MAG: hypothetical protein QOH31_2872 [Verrucomicrobiota bacterium]|jgi:hypothetical protein
MLKPPPLTLLGKGCPSQVGQIGFRFRKRIRIAEWTLDGELRQTTFLGWRDDKDRKEVVLEQTQES